MPISMSCVVGLLFLCSIYKSEGLLLDGDNPLLKAITQLNSTFQQTVADLRHKSDILNATAQQSALDLRNAKNVISTMNTTIQNSDMKISTLQQEIHRLGQAIPSPIIFYAYLSRAKSLGQDQAIVFDRVVTNVGNAYEPRHGYFKAPVYGYYHFSATVTSMPGERLYVNFVKNGNNIAHLYADQSGYHTASGSVDIELAADDNVWLKHDSDKLEKLDGAFCFFSGFIIRKTM